jgi:hypothetical protein
MAEALRSHHVTRWLVVANAGVVARPPIGAAGGVSLLAEPPAIVAIGIVVRTIDPDPHAIAEDPMAMDVAIMIAAAFRVAAMITSAIGVATAIAAIVTAGTRS